MDILRFFIHFFKTWFLPLPAHDDGSDQPGNADSSPKATKTAAVAQTGSAASNDDDKYDEDDDDDLPDPEPEYLSQQSGPAPLNPIAPPEGAEERASRSSSHSIRSTPAE